MAGFKHVSDQKKKKVKKSWTYTRLTAQSQLKYECSACVDTKGGVLHKKGALITL